MVVWVIRGLFGVAGAGAFADLFGRGAGDDGVGRHVARDNAAGGDDGAVADGRAAEDDGPVADPTIVADADIGGFESLLADQAVPVAEPVSARQDGRTPRDQAVLADLDASAVHHDLDVAVEDGVVAYADAFASGVHRIEAASADDATSADANARPDPCQRMDERPSREAAQRIPHRPHDGPQRADQHLPRRTPPPPWREDRQIAQLESLAGSPTGPIQLA